MPSHGRHLGCAFSPEASSFTSVSFPLVFDFEVLFRCQVFHRRSPFPATDDSVLPWASVPSSATEVPTWREWRLAGRLLLESS